MKVVLTHNLNRQLTQRRKEAKSQGEVDGEEVKQVRETARKFDWIKRASELMEKANALFSANKIQEAATLYSRLATIPLRVDQVEMAKQRIGLAPRTNSSSSTK